MWKVFDTGVLTDLKERWFVTTLCVVSALVFVGALGWSARNYANVIDARENVVLTDVDESAELLDNGSLELAFSVNLRNPSAFGLSIATLSWSVKLNVSAMGETYYLPLGSAYKGPTESLIIAVAEVRTFEYHVFVSDPIVLSSLHDFVNYSNDHGEDFTIETAPYIHDFRLTAWMGEFQHDYQYYGELYLNDMVRIDLGYYEGEYL